VRLSTLPDYSNWQVAGVYHTHPIGPVNDLDSADQGSLLSFNSYLQQSNPIRPPFQLNAQESTSSGAFYIQYHGGALRAWFLTGGSIDHIQVQ
jgi:hypothetical protein